MSDAPYFVNFNPNEPIYQNININESNRGIKGYFDTEIGRDTWNDMDTPPNKIELTLDDPNTVSYNYTDTPFCRCGDGEQLIKARIESDMESMDPAHYGNVDESSRDLNGVRLIWQCKPIN